MFNSLVLISCTCASSSTSNVVVRMTTPSFGRQKSMFQQEWSLNCLYSGNQTIQTCGNFEWFTRNNALLGLVICYNGPSTTVAFSVQKVPPFEGVFFFHGRSFFWMNSHPCRNSPFSGCGFAPRMAIIHVVLLPMSPCFRRRVLQHGKGGV